LRWRDALRQTWSSAATDSEAWAAELDEWFRAGGQDEDESGGDLRPVTDGLPRAGIAEEITMALAELRALDDRRPLGDAATGAASAAWTGQRRRLLERLATLFGRLA